MAKLTDTGIKALKPLDKEYSKYDGNYLYIFITPKGTKTFKVVGKFEGKSRKYRIGRYPDISLKDARKEAQKAVANYRQGLNHTEIKATEKKQEQIAKENSFSDWTKKWLVIKSNMSAKTLSGYDSRLRKYILPHIGSKPIADVTTQDIMEIMKTIESLGKLDTMSRCKTIIKQVIQQAISHGIIQYNPTQEVTLSAFRKHETKNMPFLKSPKEIAQLLRDIDCYDGNFNTLCALRIAPYIMLRPSEIRFAKWEYIDYTNAEWRIPASEMKKRRMHIVPLAKQVIDILKQLENVTGDGEYLFPQAGKKNKVMSENTLGQALNKMGYKGKQTAHGFRGMASTRLNEMGYNSNWIERQLAHKDKNTVRASYNHAEYLPQRKKMIQEWADYLDDLKQNQ